MPWSISPSTSTRSRRCATRAAARSRRCSTRCDVCVDGRRARHHRASARRRAAHHAGATCARSPRGCAPLARPRRVQHRGRSAAGSARARARGPARPVHARAGHARRDHEPGRLARRHGRRPALAGGRSATCKAAGVRVSLFVDPDAARRSTGPRRSAPTASSSTPSRSRARSSGAARERADRFALYAAAARHAARARPRRQRRPRSRPRTTCRSSATLPHLDEVSIGHALMSHALFVGLRQSVARIPRRPSGPASADGSPAREPTAARCSRRRCRPGASAGRRRSAAARTHGRAQDRRRHDAVGVALRRRRARPAAVGARPHAPPDARRLERRWPTRCQQAGLPRARRSTCAATATSAGSYDAGGDLGVLQQDVVAAIALLQARSDVTPRAHRHRRRVARREPRRPRGRRRPRGPLRRPALAGARVPRASKCEARDAQVRAAPGPARGRVERSRTPCGRSGSSRAMPARQRGARPSKAPGTARRCWPGTRTSPGGWWTGSKRRCYDRALARPSAARAGRPSMKPESLVFGIAGVFLGLIAGWLIGSQQPAIAHRPRRPLSSRRPPRPRRRRAGRRPRSCSTRPRCKRAQGHRREGSRRTPTPRTQLGEPVLRRRALRRRDRVVRRGARARPDESRRQHRPRRQLLLQEPARPGARAVRALARDRPEAHEDAC